jgi:hypothetical protein
VKERETPMKVTLESTDKIVTITTPYGPATGRIWEGVSEGGIRCHAVISTIAVHKDDDSSQFARELEEHQPASERGLKAFDPRFVL